MGYLPSEQPKSLAAAPPQLEPKGPNATDLPLQILVQQEVKAALKDEERIATDSLQRLVQQEVSAALKDGALRIVAEKGVKVTVAGDVVREVAKYEVSKAVGGDALPRKVEGVVITALIELLPPSSY